MRVLHTADWHVGKRLGRYDRTEDFRDALGQIVTIADREAVDLVLVAGDLFDRAVPSIDALGLVLDTLVRLARDRPVVAIAGNHDSADLFELLGPLVDDQGVMLVGMLRPPEDGGIIRLPVAATEVHVACLPFLREGRAVDFMADVEGWHGAYADRVGVLCQTFSRALASRARGGARGILMAHFTVSGVQLGGGGAPRGERSLHLGDTYAAHGAALGGAGVGYVAMGHIHQPQPVPGARVPAFYSGSPMALDFGEADEDKHVLIVDLDGTRPARVRPVPIVPRRPLIRARGRFEELLAREALQSALVDLTVVADGPDPGLADRARTAFPMLVKVRAAYPRPQASTPARATSAWDALYTEYHRAAHETDPAPDLLEAFREILERVTDATA